ACVFDGRIDNRDTLIRSLGRHPLATPQAEDRELIVAAYDRFGESFVERLEGDFAIGVFDRRANRLLLARDRLGLRPLCYTQFNGTLLFASEAKPLLACPGIDAIPDETMLADFILYFRASDVKTRTFFRGIHSVPPGHMLIVTPDTVTLRQYFDFDL